MPPSPRVLSLRRLALWSGWIALMVVSVIIVGQVVERAQVTLIHEQGKLRLERYRDLLGGELSKYNYLPNLVPLDERVIELLANPGEPGLTAEVNGFLKTVNQEAGSSALYLVDPAGTVIATSNWDEPISFSGIDLSYRPYVFNALRDGEAEFYGIGTTSGEPGYYFARRIDIAGEPKGVAVVKVAINRVENPWGLGADPAMVVDEYGVIILTSNPAWRYRAMNQVAPEDLEKARASRKYARMELNPLGLQVKERLSDGSSVVSVPWDATGGGSQRALFLAEEGELARSGWKIIVLSHLDGANILVRAAQIVVALVIGTIFLLFLYLSARQRSMRLRLAAKEALERANAELERNVAERTAELSAANASLRQEVAERERTEIVLREAQDGLVHAGKLAVIGQMAAGMTHELNQPVAALRTLADNALLLLDRDRPDAVRGNLEMIGRTIERMGKITSQLKSFARKSSGRPEPAPIRACLDHALALVETRLARQKIDVIRSGAQPELTALCDPTRLEQVFINLLGNAIDALSSGPPRADPPLPAGTPGRGRIDIDVGTVPGEEQSARRVRIRFRDNGPGLPPEVLARMFEPFFTTKPAGIGLGLGLTISDGILREFGGNLSARNHPDGGAEFVVEVPEAVPAAVAAAGSADGR
ncbi:MAG: ATP-binding protein [Rhodospirillales bacterium]